MDSSSWPAFSREGQDKIFHPVIEHGAVTATTLVNDNGRLVWSNLLNSDLKRALRAGPPTLVYPATRLPPVSEHQIGIRQQAEQGANFLRMELPDVDVAADLIRGKLTEAAKLQQEWDIFDPLVGNQLDCVHGQNLAVLAFPTGELGRDLNLSPLTRQTGKWEFKPFAQATQSYDTPILQISAIRTAESKLEPYIAVRTFGGTSLLEIGVDNGQLSTMESDTIRSSSTGEKPVVDVQLYSPSHVHLVNSSGIVYQWDPSFGSTTSEIFTSDQIKSDIWRLGLTNDPDVFLLMSKSNLTMVDSRTFQVAQTVYDTSSNEVLTAMETHFSDVFRICTSNQALWIDRRYTKRPLVAFKHGRAFDRSMELNTVLMDDGPLTILSSRKHGLLTVYDVDVSGNTIREVHAPYALTASAGGYQKGHFFLGDSTTATYFRLSDTGSIQAFNLSFDVPTNVSYTWSEDVTRLHLDSAYLKDEFSDPAPPAEETMLDMRQVYKRFLREPQETRSEEEIAESFYDLVERASSFWQEMNEPVDHILTSYDILFRSGEEPNQSSRADFLAESVLKTKRGFRSFSQGRVSSSALQKDAPWVHDLSQTLNKLDGEFGPDIRSLTEVHLSRFDLKADPQRSIESERRETTAREQLALDLELSRHIYSPHAFASPSSDLESMAQTLSLEDKTEFGYLRPILKEEDSLRLPNAVRLITRDWAVGQDPSHFVFRERSDMVDEEHSPKQQRVRIEDFKIESQKPPTLVVASSQRPAVAASQPVQPSIMFGSQPNMDMDFGLAGVSQDFMASTQPMPGVYGGRPKKPVKKRVGGF
ncbi:60S ribosomal protein [Mycena indigotica]|uniref:60S ribosomal protein n=1 Tax=Mycena indigotica TaxID=2126181 RepID=A0A8H6SPE8_9AGAR|nr:60S ribosomal protein [Mycena indigotica]KAF7301555.1 60S ribosomal protein [Mycena indigotica]